LRNITLASSPQQMLNCNDREDRDGEDVMAVTGTGLVVILLIGLPALLCVLAIRDLMKIAKHRRARRAALQAGRPLFVRTQPISPLTHEDA